MRKFGITLFVALLACLAGYAASPITLLSYNVRNSGAGDGFHAWENRCQATPVLFEREEADVIGLQEALADQLQYIDTHCPAYARVGVGRDDGKTEGETMAIYYKKERFELLDSGTLWLSETPDQVSRGWDGACNRTMTWVKLQEKQSGKQFYYFNTHLDHRGSVARAEGIKLVAAKVLAIAGKKEAVIVGGDMNSSTESKIYDPIKKIMKEVRVIAPVSDNKGTFNGFGSAPDTIVIDHLFVRGKIKCQEFKTLDGNYGVTYISDHYPIKMLFTLN